MTIREMADALGKPSSSYAAYEDPKKYKKPILPFDLTKQIADILEPRGVSRTEVMQLAGLKGNTGATEIAEEEEELWVNASVAAGVWREQPEWPREDWYPLKVGPSPVAGGERFAIRMEGYSMDRTIPPGSDLECIRVAFGSVDPQPGDLVIVERHSHDLTETTCKRLDRVGDDWVLRSESTKPEFQEVIPIGRPDVDAHIDNEIRVTGIVLKAHQNHFRRR